MAKKRQSDPGKEEPKQFLVSSHRPGCSGAFYQQQQPVTLNYRWHPHPEQVQPTGSRKRAPLCEGMSDTAALPEHWSFHAERSSGSCIIQQRLLPSRCAHLQLTGFKAWPESHSAIKSEGIWVSLKLDGENSPAQISSLSQTLVSCNHIQYSIIRFNYSTFGIAVGEMAQSASSTTMQLFGLWLTVCPGPHSVDAGGFRQRLLTSEDKPD